MKSPRDALRAYLKRTDTTITDFAARVGVTRPAISMLLSDEEREPTLSLALAIQRETNGLIPASAWEQAATHHA